jgi:hypothetical protein
MHRRQRSLALSLILLSACGGAAPAPVTGAPEAHVVVPSFVPADATVVLRFDGRTTRSTAIADAVSQMIAVSGTWSRLSAGSGADPIADVDIMLCASAAMLTDGALRSHGWYFVLRHTHTPTEVESRIARMAESNGVPARWETRDGFRYVPLPVQEGGFAPHFAMPTAVGEIVVAPISDLERVLAVARAQAEARRADEPVDPYLATAENEIVYLRIDPRGQSLPTGDLPPIVALELRGEKRATQIALDLRLAYATAEDAETARARIDDLRRQLSDHPMARMVGLAHVLTQATLMVTDVSLTASALLDERTARNMARFLAQAQQGGF